MEKISNNNNGLNWWNEIGCIIAYVVYAMLSFTIIGLVFSIPGFIKTTEYFKKGESRKFAGIWAIFFGGIIPGILILI